MPDLVRSSDGAFPSSPVAGGTYRHFVASETEQSSRPAGGRDFFPCRHRDFSAAAATEFAAAFDDDDDDSEDESCKNLGVSFRRRRPLREAYHMNANIA